MDLFPNKEKFIDDVRKSKILNFDEELISGAWDFAIKVYSQQPRKSGEVNFSQPVDVARLLLSVDCDSASIAAALLYSSVENEKVRLDDLKAEFSPEIVMLVEGVTKLAPLDCPPDKAWMSEKVRYEQLRKFFIANISDYRVA